MAAAKKATRRKTAKSRKKQGKRAEKPAEPRFNIYVIELDPGVLRHPRFRAANPDYRGQKPCVYVGMTACTPAERFDQHMRGYKSAKYVARHGVRLRPRLYASLNPMTFDQAKAMEVEKARRLRQRGYAVWQK